MSVPCTIDAPGRSRGTPPDQRAHRDSIFVEDGKLLARQEYPGKQFVIRVHAPKCAAAATPGSFAHLTCDPERPMRRPLSLMRVDPRAGWIEILYKIVGPGLEALSQQPVGATISVLGPIGKGFVVNPSRPRTLLIGGGVGIPPMVFLAESLKQRQAEARWQPLVLMGSEIEFPFRARPSQIVPHLADALRILRTRHGADGAGWPSMTAVVTGPSRTGDIERILVLGAHGPKRLTVLLLEG